MTEDITKKDKQDWENFVNSKEKIPSKDTQAQNTKIFKTKKISNEELVIEIKKYINKKLKTVTLNSLEEKFNLDYSAIKNLQNEFRPAKYIKNKRNENLTNLTLCALDSGTKDGRIRLEYKKDFVYQGIDTNRTYATLCIKDMILSEEDQIRVAKEFNALLETRRKQYWSLFLPQYRESKEYARKRIPFDLSSKIVANLLSSHSK